MNVQRIVNLPTGGGANSGRDTWFAIETEDGGRQELQIYSHQLDTLILSLRRFGASAEDLLEKNNPGSAQVLKKYWPKATNFKADRADGGDLGLSFLDDSGTSLRVVVPAERIKPLLFELLRAMSSK